MISKNANYRPDIDGLRALAVMLVLLFHFELGVKGGFVGVDVFFVISGYLITSVIRRSIKTGAFSFYDFYVGRLLRLHPALLATVGISLLLGFLLMDPSSLKSLASSSGQSLLSISNFYFWLNQGYFDAASKTQAMLHTWSLSTEWQFYLVWPFIIWGAIKISDRTFIAILLLLIVASVTASQIMLKHDAQAAYFMMPFRVFELSIGAILVFSGNYRISKKNESLVAVSGLLLIIGSSAFLNSASPFPGLLALIPCIGAAACIYSGNSKYLSILRTPPAVQLGLISYSVYLVHWPILVFYKYYIFRELNTVEKIILLALSIITGLILYRLIEKPFHYLAKSNRKRGTTLLAFFTSALCAVCLTVVIQNGLPSRIHNQWLSSFSDLSEFHRKNYGGYGYDLTTILGDKTGKQVAVIAGDSFAMQYAYGLDERLKARAEYILGEFQHGCIISSKYTRLSNNAPLPGCRESFAKILQKLGDSDTPLIFAQHWSGYRGIILNSSNDVVPSINDTDYSAVILDILKTLRSDIGSRELILIGSQPVGPGGSPASCLMKPTYVPQKCTKLLTYSLEKSASNDINEIVKKFALTNARTLYIDPADALCKNGKCETYQADKIFYSDTIHLSRDGSELASKLIIERLEKP